MPRPELGQVRLAGQHDRVRPELAALGRRAGRRAPDPAPGSTSMTAVRSWIVPPRRSTARARPRTSLPGCIDAYCVPNMPPSAPSTRMRSATPGRVEPLVVAGPAGRLEARPMGLHRRDLAGTAGDDQAASSGSIRASINS